MDTIKTALVIIDMQKESNFGIENVDQIADRTSELIAECRKHRIPIIYTRQINRSDGIGLSQQEPLNQNNEPVFYNNNSDAIDIIETVQPQSQDIVIDKYRWSSFNNTSLDLILRGMGIEHIILGGFVTDGCVMTTAFDAFFQDYQVTLVKDICGSTNEGSHMSSILIMANWIYNLTIIDTSEMLKKLSGNGYHAWESIHPDQLPFSPENIRHVFGKLDHEANILN